MPTTSVRRLISPLGRSSGLMERTFCRWSFGTLMKARDIGFSFVHERGNIWHLRMQLIGDLIRDDRRQIARSREASNVDVIEETVN